MNVAVRGLWILVEERRGGHDDARQAEPALRRLLVDERLLQRMRSVRSAEAFERRDLSAVQGAYRRDAGANRTLPDDHRARPALTQAASELWPAKRQIVAEHIQQRRRRIDVDHVSRAVHRQGKLAHGALPLEI